MMMTTGVLMWWFLARAYGNGTEPFGPRAFGPYPSAEFCRKAAENLMPEARQFWTAAHRAEQDRTERETKAKYAAQREAIKKRARDSKANAKGPVGGWEEIYDPKGEQVGMSYVLYSGFESGSNTISGGYTTFVPVVGCAAIETPGDAPK